MPDCDAQDAASQAEPLRFDFAAAFATAVGTEARKTPEIFSSLCHCRALGPVAGEPSDSEKRIASLAHGAGASRPEAPVAVQCQAWTGQEVLWSS